MAVLVRSCCCGCSLKTGVLVIAFLGLIGGGYNIYANFSNASALSKARDEGLSSSVSTKHLQVLINLLLTSGVFSILELLTSISLFAACSMKNRFLVLPYLVLHVILLGYILGVVIYYIVAWGSIAVIFILIGAIISWLLWIYFLIVVYSFHEALREDPSGSSAGFISDNPSGIAPNANYTV